MDTKNGRKLYEINILKAVAFLAVVFQSALFAYFHHSDVLIEETIIVALLYTFVKFSAPVFIFVTGFLLLNHHYAKVKYKDFITNKIADTYVPFLFWTLIYSTLLFQYPHLTWDWLLMAGQQIVIGSAAPHLWYVVMVFQFYLLYPLLLVIYKKIQTKMQLSKINTIVGFSIITLGYLLLLELTSNYVFNGIYLTDIPVLKYLDRSFLLYSFYFIFGGTAALYITTWRKFVEKSVHWNGILLVCLFVWVGYGILSFENIYQIELSYSTPLKPSMFLFNTSQIIMLYGLSITIVKSKGLLFRLLNFIGKYTFGSYLAHYLFIYIIVGFLDNFAFTNIFIMSTLTFVLTVVSSVLFTFIVSSLPFGKAIIGPFEKVENKQKRFVHFISSTILKSEK